MKIPQKLCQDIFRRKEILEIGKPQVVVVRWCVCTPNVDDDDGDDDNDDDDDDNDDDDDDDDNHWI